MGRTDRFPAALARSLLGVAGSLWLLAVVGRASAHSGSLGGAAASTTVPTWLVVLTGGIVVGASFLFTTLLTDHEAIRSVNWWGRSLPAPARTGRVVTPALRALGVGLLALVVATGLVGPAVPTRNFALLFVWVGWWSGYTMTTYLVGNSWPLVDPWRTLAALFDRALARLDGGAVPRYEVPARLGVWPSVAGLLALVWLEVVSPVGSNPRLLAVVVLGYTAVTVAGGVLVSDWFERVDPVSRVFAVYGRLAPLQRTDDGVRLRLPTAPLTDRPLADRPGEVAFVVALLWVTTYDGLVSTPTWAAVTERVASLGVPPLAVYLATLLVGFGVFLGVYRLAARRVRTSADTYVTTRAIERWFAPALLPIAAGYHVAHFLGYFLALLPALAAVAASPLAPPASTVALVLPGWFGSVKLLCVLGGHVLAVWVAHSLAFELFPGVLAAIRSQYPTVVVMILYTMSSLWVITQPYAQPVLV